MLISFASARSLSPGKSKLVERFLMNDYVPRQMSTYALTVFRHKQKQDDGREIEVDFWVSHERERDA